MRMYWDNECRRLRMEWKRMLLLGIENTPDGAAVRHARTAARKRATAANRIQRERTKPRSVVGEVRS